MLVQPVKAYSSHTDWILSLAWSPESAHHLVTASQDNTLKLWDIRTNVPLHTIDSHTEKVRCFVSGSPRRLAQDVHHAECSCLA